MKRSRLGGAIAILLGAALMTTDAAAADPENTLYMDLEHGRVVIEMRPDLAPKHVEQIKRLTRSGFYDGVVFHRVIDGFMAQGGDPTGTGTGGSGDKLPAEFSNESHVRGVTSMARTQDPNSADSQFFIMFAPAPISTGSTPSGQGDEGNGNRRQAQAGVTTAAAAWSQTRTRSSACRSPRTRQGELGEP